MIRPRIGHFVYSTTEKRVMTNDLRAFAEISPVALSELNGAERGITGVVFGALTVDGRVDVEFTSLFVMTAKEYGFEGWFLAMSFFSRR